MSHSLTVISSRSFFTRFVSLVSRSVSRWFLTFISFFFTAVCSGLFNCLQHISLLIAVSQSVARRPFCFFYFFSFKLSLGCGWRRSLCFHALTLNGELVSLLSLGPFTFFYFFHSIWFSCSVSRWFCFFLHCDLVSPSWPLSAYHGLSVIGFSSLRSAAVSASCLQYICSYCGLSFFFSFSLPWRVRSQILMYCSLLSLGSPSHAFSFFLFMFSFDYGLRRSQDRLSAEHLFTSWSLRRLHRFLCFQFFPVPSTLGYGRSLCF